MRLAAVSGLFVGVDEFLWKTGEEGVAIIFIL